MIIENIEIVLTQPSGIEIVLSKGTRTAADIKALYESNADTNAYTDAEKTKLASLDNHFLGSYTSLANLQTAHASASLGDYADVDAGSGTDAERYIWDTDEGWVKAVGTQPGETNASIKAKYEANANTNAYTDAEQDKVSYIQLETANPADKIIQTNGLSPENSVLLYKNGRLTGWSALKYTSNGLEILGPVALVDNTGAIYGQLRRIGTDTELRAEGANNLLLNAPLGEVQITATNLNFTGGNATLGDFEFDNNFDRLRIGGVAVFQKGGEGIYFGNSSNTLTQISGGGSSIQIQGSGVRINGTASATAALNVDGNGSDGNTSALLVKNFSGVTTLDAKDDGSIDFGSRALLSARGQFSSYGGGGITTNLAFSGGALNSNTTGFYNIAIGPLTLRDGKTNKYVVATGGLSLLSFSGSRTVTYGYETARTAFSGTGGTIIGDSAGRQLTALSYETLIGCNSGRLDTTGSFVTSLANSVLIGANTRPLASGDVNEIIIGDSADGNGSNTATIGNNSITNTYLKGTLNTESLVYADNAAAIEGGLDIGDHYNTSTGEYRIVV